uniref:Uncharacterized protein n=1 Tax=Trichogramma kaykai TaxID=54128 RepID=A0ABD2WB32_9HYME
MEVASGALSVVESLNKRGYELEQSDALTIMKFFAKYELFEKSAELHKFLHDKDFAKELKEVMVSQSLSLYDLIQLQPREAAKRLTYLDYLQLENSCKLWRLPQDLIRACALHLCEKLSRGFFLRWAVEPLMELIHYRLPILCCDMIIEQLTNNDLCNVCLAASTDESS